MSPYIKSPGEKLEAGFQLLLARTVKKLQLLEPAGLQPRSFL